jgi:tripartite ATP-independent transporter DctM subunit
MTILIAIAIFLFLLMINMPVSFAIGIGAVISGLTLWDVDNTTIVQRMMAAINVFPLLAVIFFIFAGVLMARGGISGRLVRLAEVIVGRIPGGLAHINILSSMFFGGVSGSAVADVSSIGAMMIPAMEKDGYSKPYATAVTLTSAIMGPIIPPSIAMIIFAHVAGSVSIAGLFLAGAIPGVLIGLGLMGVAFIHAKLYHKREISASSISLKEKLIRVVDGMAGMTTIVIILGGITSGIFTATEAGAVAAFYALILTVCIYRSIKLRELPAILYECCIINAVVLFLVATSSVFTWILTYENFPMMVADMLLSVTQNKILILLILNVLLLFLGMFIDQTPAIIMLVPVLLPLAQRLDIHMIHLGVIVVINLSFGLITPPVGTSLFVGCRIANLPITAVVRPMLPFLPIMIAVLFLVTYVPAIIMWLPTIFGFA